jgi:hypothetical protein
MGLVFSHTQRGGNELCSGSLLVRWRWVSNWEVAVCSGVAVGLAVIGSHSFQLEVFVFTLEVE